MIAEKLLTDSKFSYVVNGRFKGGWTTRHYGHPESGVSAFQLEIAHRAYLHEPQGAVNESNWPPAFDPNYANALRATLTQLLRNFTDYTNGTHHDAP
jgi:formiminoglutamase